MAVIFSLRPDIIFDRKHLKIKIPTVSVIVTKEEVRSKQTMEDSTDKIKEYQLENMKIKKEKP